MLAQEICLDKLTFGSKFSIDIRVVDAARPVDITKRNLCLHGWQRGLLLQTAFGHHEKWGFIVLKGSTSPIVLKGSSSLAVVKFLPIIKYLEYCKQHMQFKRMESVAIFFVLNSRRREWRGVDVFFDWPPFSFGIWSIGDEIKVLVLDMCWVVPIANR